MQSVNRDELRLQVEFALRRRGVIVNHIEILPIGAGGGWCIGSSPLTSAPAAKIADLIEQVELELFTTYRLRPPRRGERSVA